MSVEILQGDALEVLKTLPSDHFHCVVTSPPYFGLRDYGTGSWEGGGDPACDHRHEQTKTHFGAASTLAGTTTRQEACGSIRGFRDVCGKCGARRIDQQIGLEPTPDAWCARLVEVFREVKRVLRSDGCAWINCGDAFRNKQLLGLPWRLAFALQQDGWILRSEIIWAKPAPMPESVTDRPTKAHEQVFLLAKSNRYYFDSIAIAERKGDASISGIVNGSYRGHERVTAGATSSRNARSVWTIATDPLPSIEVDGEKLDHFASYPVELARRCILAGTSAKGCCPQCGAPWARVVERDGAPEEQTDRQRHLTAVQVSRTGGLRNGGMNSTTFGLAVGEMPARTTTGWRPTCVCTVRARPCGESVTALPIPCRVLDPFFGSGRTGLACEELGRDCVGIELNPKSVAMAHAQLERAKARRMIGDVTDRAPVHPGQLSLFDGS